MARNACIRVLFVALAVAALAHSTCIDKIRELVGRGRMGGWKIVADSQNNVVVREIVDFSMELYKRHSSDLHQFEQPEYGTIEAYQQLVNGVNYCVQFPLVSVECTNGTNSDCSTDETFICSVSAYKPRTKSVIVNSTSLVCYTVA